MQQKLTFTVRKSQSESIENPPPFIWEAFINERPNVVYGGDTDGEAVTSLLNGVAQLCAEHSLDPLNPERVGLRVLGPIQMCLEILQVELNRQNALACSNISTDTELGDNASTNYSELKEHRRFIGNIGTAIAALSRVESP